MFKCDKFYEQSFSQIVIDFIIITISGMTL
jgi:hypothetical protein